MMWDLVSDLGVATLLAPAAAGAANTPYVSTILDCAGKTHVGAVLVSGVQTDADATFTVLLEESNAANMAGANVVAVEDTNGTVAQASLNFADDAEPRKIGYKGAKRYIRLTITPALNDAGNHFFAGLWLFRDMVGAEPNPPV